MAPSLRRRRFGAVSAVLSLALAAACAPQPTSSQPENTTPAKDALEDAKHPGVEACAKGDVDAALEISRNFRESAHEMVVCGGLSAAFMITAIEVLLRSASGSSTRADGFAYQGKGVYTAGTRMELRTTLAADTSFGKAGDAFAFDLFDAATYVKDAKLVAKVTADTNGNSRSSLHLEVREKGPAYELLGLPTTADGVVDVDFDVIVKSLGSKILVEQTIVMEDTHDSTVVKYKLHGPPSPLGQFAAGGSMQMDLVSVDAASKATGQVITVTNWAMEYASAGSSGTLDGAFSFDVRGGAFDYRASFTYPHRKEPDVALSCL